MCLALWYWLVLAKKCSPNPIPPAPALTGLCPDPPPRRPPSQLPRHLRLRRPILAFSFVFLFCWGQKEICNSMIYSKLQKRFLSACALALWELLLGPTRQGSSPSQNRLRRFRAPPSINRGWLGSSKQYPTRACKHKPLRQKCSVLRRDVTTLERFCRKRNVGGPVQGAVLRMTAHVRRTLRALGPV